MPYTDQLNLNGLSIPIQIYIERRNGTRVSFTTKGINLRISNHLRRHEVDDQIAWCKNWALKKIEKNPSIGYRYIDRDYKEGSVIKLFDQKLIVVYRANTKKNDLITLLDEEIIIYSNDHSAISSAQIKRTLIKILNKNYHAKIAERVRYINSHSVKKTLKKVTIKYLKSQWGNCRTDGQIKLSTRILLLPERIQNAIILHELVHLVHFDHSPAFYNTLQSHMPDYKARDKWLKQYEGMVDF